MESVIDITEMYERILEVFIDPTCVRDWNKNPFLIGNKAAATNASAMVVVPKWIGYYMDQSERVKGLYPFSLKKPMPIVTAAIKDAFSRFPMVDQYDFDTVECEACNGSGTVEYEFEHKHCTYITESDCPICEDGTLEVRQSFPNGKQYPDPNAVLRLGNSCFLASRITELIKVADIMEADEVSIVGQENHQKATWFKIKEVDLLLMPAIHNGDSAIIIL